MSENIIIQEGGIGKQLTVDKLKTNLVGGGTCNWVPEDEVQLGTKTITENGTYSASADGLAGYSSVTVNVAGGGDVTGKASDGSGDDARAYVDPETGQIVEEKIPSSIKVITPPTNPYGTYIDGQTITKDGMVVKGYLESGSEWGTVPTADVTINPTKAVYDESTDIPGGEQVDTDLDLSPIASPFNSGYTEFKHRYSSWGENDYYLIETTGGVMAAFSDGYASSIVFAGTAPFTKKISYVVGGVILNTDETTISTQYTLNNKTVYYSGSFGMTGILEPAGNSVNGAMPTNKSGQIAWAMMYGTKTPIQAGSRQNITASWPRPGDGTILETSFEILVGPRAGQGDD